jgi:MerR family transcriptional regulator, copper efflux regulator
MKIGELAAKTAMAPSAIRFYEQSGLLPPVERGANGYRVYSEVVLERLLVIQMAQNLGFSLDAMRSVFANNKGFPQAELLARLDMRLNEIEQMVATLRSQRDDLPALRSTLRDTWAEGQCVDVADLAAGVRKSAQRKPGLKRRVAG